MAYMLIILVNLEPEKAHIYVRLVDLTAAIGKFDLLDTVEVLRV